jgi:hypothetical protein
VPGIIEDEEPDDEGGPILSSTISFALSSDVDAPAVPPFDVELFLDRLRFMGLDRELIDEADRRLRVDVPSGMKWLEERMKELEPPRQPPECQCGEALVDADWRGRATVRCTVCGARWGVAVIDEENESLWEVSGPTAEWRAAHPIEDYDPYGEFDPEDVLRDGLPPLPTEIDAGSYFPVAMWSGERDAAVLYAHRRTPGDFDLPGDEYEDETEHLVLADDGEWMSTGSGGGNWVNVFDPPVELLEKYVVLGTGTTGSGDDDEAIYFTGGLCSSIVAVVETTDRRGTRSYEIDPARPFFVVGIHGSGRVRILDSKGNALSGRTGEPLEYEIGD